MRRLTASLRTPLGACAAVSLGLVFLLAIFGPIIWGDQARQVDSTQLRMPPGDGHPFGTDGLGRDIFARVLVATRLSVELALAATAITVIVGLLLGGAPSVLGRRAGRLATTVVNMGVAFPGLFTALVLAVVFGVGSTGAVLAIGLAGAPSFARLTQNLAASVSGSDYVMAARILGVGRMRLLLRHVLPNIAEPLIVTVTIGAGQALLSFAGLSFLGLGVQPPDYDWGRMLSEGLSRIYVNPAAALAPGAAVVFAGLAFSFAGEALAQSIGLRDRRSRPLDGPDPVVIEEPPPARADAVLDVAALSVSFPGGADQLTPVEGVTFSIAAGERVGLVGESGSGKSLTALAVAGLVEEPGRVRAERIIVAGAETTGLSYGERNRVLGTDVAMVFQDPMTSLNPSMRVGRQLAEVVEVHEARSRREGLARAIDRLRAVRIAAPGRRAAQYPHELSGGMRQRAMIGMGLMAAPKLVIADEPTTALDVTVQRDVLRLLVDVNERVGAAILLISHDLAVVTQVCDRVLVMYAGTIVEDLSVEDLLAGPAHPYTRALLAAVPDLDADRGQPLATIPGRQPAPGDRPPGCPFAARCVHASERCAAERPVLRDRAEGSGRAACWHPQTGPLVEVSSREHA